MLICFQTQLGDLDTVHLVVLITNVTYLYKNNIVQLNIHKIFPLLYLVLIITYKLKMLLMQCYTMLDIWKKPKENY